MSSTMIPLTTFFVAGVNFRLNAFRAAHATDKLTIVPEPENQYDKYALKIMLGDQHIGYVPRTEGALMHDLLGCQIPCLFEINKFDQSRDCKPYEACSIKVWAERHPMDGVSGETAFNTQ